MRTIFFVVLLIVGHFSSICHADQKELLRLYSAVPAGPGQHLRISPQKGLKVTPRNVARKLGPVDGFPRAMVNEFSQSADGTIWMATDVGLYSYDGYQVRHFDTGVLQNATCVRAIVCDGFEGIWLGTNAGLAILSVDKQSIVYLDQFKGVDILCMGEDNQGRPLVGTAEGLFVCSRGNLLKVKSSIIKSAARSIETDTVNEVTWIGTDHGICTLQGLELERQSVPEIDDLPVCKLHLDRLGALWIGTDRSVFRLKSGEVTRVHSDKVSRRDYVRNFAESETELMISLSNTTVGIPSDQLDVDSPRKSFRARKRGVNSSFIDRDGNVWAGAEFPATIFFTRSDLRNYTTDRCQHLFREPGSDTIWLANNPARSAQKIVRMQGGEFNSWEVRGRISDFAWHKGRILVGTNYGVVQLNGDEVVPHPSPDLANKVVLSIASGPDDDLWIATDKGVYRIHDDKVSRHEFGGDFGTIVRVLPWQHGLTVASAAKIRHYDSQDKLLEEIDFAKDVASRRIVGLLRSDDGRLWVGSSCGLFSQRQVGEPLHLERDPDRFLGLFLAKAQDGKLWAGSFSGPCQIDPETRAMQTLLPADINGPQKISDCLVHGDFTWFVGEKGLFRYQKNSSSPELVVDRITSDRELPGDEPVYASTDNKLLTVSFRAITPGMRNGSTLYRHRLLGKSDQWSESHRNEIELRDLPVGEYSLEIQAFDINLAASEIVTVPIVVSVPALRYAAFGAIFLSLLLVLLAACFTFYFQRQQNRSMAKQVSEAVSKQLRLEEGLRQAQKLESLGTLASGMAHDFNNMLQVVSTCTEAAKHVGDRDLMLQNLNMVQDAASQAQCLTRSMLSLAGDQPRQSEIIDLATLSFDCLTMVRQTFPRSIEIQQELKFEQTLLVEVDPEQIKQVLVNLFFNARDAMPSGGILTVSVQCITKDNDQLAQVEIRDTGSGIPNASIDRIFEPFYTTKPRGKGTGLGLAVAKGVIKGHNGSITVESTEGHFTCVTLRLPVASRLDKGAIGPPKKLSVDNHSIATSKKTVLVAEDQELVRKLLVQILEGSNFDVLTADNGAKALELAYKTHPDVLVLDVDMPILDGLSVLSKIRSSGYETPAVIISGAPLQASLPHNAVVLLKPFTNQELREAALSQAGNVEASAAI